MDQRRQTAGRREIWFLFQNISEGSWSVEALELLGQLKVRSLRGVDLEDAAEVVCRRFGRDEEVAFPVFSRLVVEFTRRRLKRRVFVAFCDMWKCGSGRERGTGRVKIVTTGEENRVAGGGAPVGPEGRGPAHRCRFVPFVSGDSGPHLQKTGGETRERTLRTEDEDIVLSDVRNLIGRRPVGPDGYGPAGSVTSVSGDSGPHLRETGGKIRDVLLTGEYVVKMMKMSEDTRSYGKRKRRSKCGRAGRPRHAWRKHGRKGKTIKRKRRGVTERAEARRRHGGPRKLWKTRGLRQKRRNGKRPRGPPGVRSEGTSSRGFRKARIGCAFLEPGLGPGEEITHGVDSEFRWLVLMGTRGGEG
jgi:hypothetical protein